MKGVIIHQRYRIDRKISRGDSSRVYEGTDLELDEKVAIKLSCSSVESSHLLGVDAVVQKLFNEGCCPGITQMRWVGQSGKYQAIVSDPLGPSLEDLFNLCGRKFSLKTILLIADQVLARLLSIDSFQYLHRDIKPEHLLMGVGRQENVIHVVGFGAAKEFDYDEAFDADDDTLMAKVDDTPMAPRRGTHLFASISSHEGKEPTFRDDAESLAYMLIYLAKGTLPWEDAEAPTDDQLSKLIKEMKKALPVETLCDGLPKEFAWYLRHARNMTYADRPDYELAREVFEALYKREGFTRDNVFDWTDKLSNEV